GEPQRHVDGLAEREALDGDHRLVMVARNDRVELAARRAQEYRVGRERPRDLHPRFAARLDRRRYLRRLLDAEEPALRAVRVQRGDGYARTRDAPALQLPLGQARDADDSLFLD